MEQRVIFVTFNRGILNILCHHYDRKAKIVTIFILPYPYILSYHLVLQYIMKSAKSKSKSKSKSKTKVRVQSPINKAKSIKKSVKKSAKIKEILLHMNCLKGKVIFNISNLDQYLGRALMRMINAHGERLKNSSLLLQMRLPKKVNQEITYKHIIDTKEALSLFNYLTTKKEGRVDIVQQLYELTQITKQYNVPANESIPNTIRFNEKIEQIRKGIKSEYLRQKTQRIESYQYDNQNEDKIKSILLVNKIKQLTISLLGQIIVAIRQKDKNQVEIIFEQCYPEKTCSIQHLKDMIGEQTYYQKKVNFVREYEVLEDRRKNNKNLIVCHQCKKVLHGGYARCSREDLLEFKPSYKNSPHIYQKNLLAFDYCYHPVDYSDKLEQQMEYFRYYKHRNHFCCFRFTCNSCLSRENQFKQPRDIHTYTCKFCYQICTCKSCCLAQEILQYLALFKNILIINEQPMDQLIELINFVNLNSDQIIVQQHLRSTFSETPFKKYEQYVEKLKEEFIVIDKACSEYQNKMMKANKIEDDEMANSLIKKVRLYMMEKRRKVGKMVSNGDLIERVWRLNVRYSEQQRKGKKLKKKEELRKGQMTQEDERNNPKKTLKNLSLAEKFNSYSVQFQSNVRFRVPSQVYYKKGKGSAEYLNKLKDKFQPLDQNLIKNLITIKRYVPYSQQDYDADINVLPKNIIKKEQHLNVDSSTSHRIYQRWNDPSFGLTERIGEWKSHILGEESIDDLYRSESSDFNESQEQESMEYEVDQVDEESSYAQVQKQDYIRDINDSSSGYQDGDSKFLRNLIKQSSEIQYKRIQNNSLQQKSEINQQLPEKKSQHEERRFQVVKKVGKPQKKQERSSKVKLEPIDISLVSQDEDLVEIKESEFKVSKKSK